MSDPFGNRCLKTLITNEISEKELINRKIIFLVTTDLPQEEIDASLLDIFKKSFKLGLTWIISKGDENDGIIMFRKTNE